MKTYLVTIVEGNEIEKVTRYKTNKSRLELVLSLLKKANDTYFIAKNFTSHIQALEVFKARLEKGQSTEEAISGLNRELIKEFLVAPNDQAIFVSEKDPSYSILIVDEEMVEEKEI